MFFSRGKNKVQNCRNLSDMYKEYSKESEYDIDFKLFYNVCDEFYKEVGDKLLEGKTFNLPLGLGAIDIIKVKHREFGGSRNSIDWENTIKYGKVIWHLNEHSNGFYYKFLWTKPRSLKYGRLYSFHPTRTLKRTLVQLIKNKEQDYYELD